MGGMDVTLALVADAANLSDEGKLNILGAFNVIGAPNFPAVHSRMVMVLRFAVHPGEAGLPKDVKIVLVNADGVIMGSLPVHVDLPEVIPPGATSDGIFPLENVVFPASGDYVFEIQIGGETKTGVRLTLVENPG